MKQIKILTTYSLALLAIGGVTSCKKEKGKEVALETTNFADKSLVQVYNGIVAAAKNYIYMDGGPLTGAVMNYPSTFPSTPSSFAVTSGLRGFVVNDTSSVTTQVPLVFSQNFQPGANYTIFMYDTTTSPKQKTVYNTIQVPADTTARLRFANFIYNPTAIGTGFDIFSVKRNAVIFTNVQETEVTPFIPYASSLNDTFYIRLTGSGANLVNVNPTSGATTTIQATLNPTPKRSYTLIWRGGYRASNTNNTTSIRALSTFSTY